MLYCTSRVTIYISHTMSHDAWYWNKYICIIFFCSSMKHIIYVLIWCTALKINYKCIIWNNDNFSSAVSDFQFVWISINICLCHYVPDIYLIKTFRTMFLCVSQSFPSVSFLDDKSRTSLRIVLKFYSSCERNTIAFRQCPYNITGVCC